MTRNPGLPVQRAPHNPDAHVIMTPELRKWLEEKRRTAKPADQ